VDAFSVSFYGLPSNADAAARSMLRLLLPMLGNRWRSGESNQSDVVILEAETLAELQAKGAARSDTLFIVFADNALPPPGAFATVQRPLHSARLVELLHMAQAELEKRSGQFGNTTIIAATCDSGDTQLSERTIRTSMRTAVRWLLQDPSRGVTVLDPKQKRILAMLPGKGFTTRLRSSDLADLIRANAQVDLVELNHTEKVALDDGRPFEPMKKLQWIYWLTGSNGEIRPELKVSHPYQLRKYPDFAVLPHHRSDVVMASLLKSEPLTVGELAKRANVRLETACNFVNACWALGYLGDPKKGTRSAGGAVAKTSTYGEAGKERAGGLLAPLRKLGLLSQ